MNPIARRTDVIVQEVGPDVVVYDQLTDTAHSLNGVAGFVYRSADGTRSATEIATRLGTELAVADAPELTEAALWQLEQANLLASPASKPTDRQMSRRAAVARFGATALALATVTSLVAPTPAMARSGHSLHPRPSRGPKKGHKDKGKKDHGSKNKGKGKSKGRGKH